jgi:hypothetical protein
MKKKHLNLFIIGSMTILYLVTSSISTYHSIDFFKLSNPNWLAVTLAIAYEIGAAASLASLIALKKINKTLVWLLFICLTAMQINANLFYTYSHLQDYHYWVELFGLSEEDPIFQKRILSIISGAILPLVALGFIKSLVDYIKPTKEISIDPVISDDFQIGPEGAYEHTEEIEEAQQANPPIEEVLGIDDNNVKEQVSPDINTIEEYLGLDKPKKKMNPHIRPGVN